MIARLTTLLLIALFCGSLGCGGPDQVNIQLRKDKQNLAERVQTLTLENGQLRSQIRALERNVNAIETLPQDRLDQLFTVAGVKLGRLTGRADAFDGLRVHVEPFDEDGDTIKAIGTVTVEAFDLAAGEGESVRAGQWVFDASENKQRWLSGMLGSRFAFECHWETAPPQGSDLLVKVTFVDSLTGRTFQAQMGVE